MQHILPSWRDAILVVDDDVALLEVCVEELSAYGFIVEAATTAADAFQRAQSGSFDVVLTDLRLPGSDGLCLLRDLKRACPEMDVLVMTGHGTIETAVEALKLGAYDFITKPFPMDGLVHRIRHLAEKRQLAAENQMFRRQALPISGPAGLVGSSAPMRQVYELLARLSNRSQPVLITGETGTGKELVARALHDLSHRAHNPFVAVDCGALHSGLIESELFGHRQGAFTGAVRSHEGLLTLAGKGTVFLDEVGELPLDLQAKLLRTLQERELRPLGSSSYVRLEARIIAATNRDLSAAVGSGTFRSDLFYRLNVFPVVVPPLRERKEDIAPLAQYFIQKNCPIEGDPVISGISSASIRCLEQYHWPGNVRELQNHIYRAMATSRGPLIQVGDLAPELRTTCAEGLSALEQAEKEAIVRALVLTGGHRMAAARLLKIGKTCLYKKLKRYGISNEEHSSDEETLLSAHANS